MILASFYLITLFFSKKPLFPKVYIAIMVIYLVSIPVDAWLVNTITPDEPFFDEATSKEFLRILLMASIWVPYMLVSQRVKATFVKQDPNDNSYEQPTMYN